MNLSINPSPVAGQVQQSGATGESSTVGNNGMLMDEAGIIMWMDSGFVDTSSNGNLAKTEAAATATDRNRVGANANIPDSPFTDAADNIYAPLLGSESAGIALGGGSQGGANAVYVDPLVLDLNGDGVRLTDYGSAPVLFDADNDGGSKEQSGWVDVNDGIVVHDLNANGAIDGIHETLSEYYNGTVGTSGNAGSRPYANGLAALKSLDSNADNVFTSADAAWSNLRVWVDADHDAITDAGELKTFDELGITSINLAGTTQSGLIRDGNEVLATSTFTMTVGGNSVTGEAIAANFLTNPNGHIFTSSGNGTVVLTQGGGTGANGQAIASVSSYVSHSATGETIDVAAKGVQNAYGSVGNDTLTGDAGNNWLAGGQGSDTFNAGAGDDVLLIDASDLQANIHAGSGLDIVQVVGEEGVMLNLAQAEVEIAQGGRGNDIFIGGGRSSVFVRGGEGDDIIIGGAANDALSGEDGDDLVDGGAGNDILRGHRGRDVIMGGAGDDLLEGGMDDDSLSGGEGNDALTGGQGDDVIDGGAGTDIAQFSGSFSEYRVTRTDTGVWFSDTVAGRDGTDFLKGVEKANFRDVSLVEIPSDTSAGLANPLPVKDVLTKDKNGAALVRGASSFRFTQAQLLGNDVDWQGGALTLNGFSDVQGGTVTLDNGDVLFTPTAGFQGIYGFKYTIKDAQNNNAATVVDLNTGATAQMKAAVYLKTTDLPSDPLVTDQWYLNEAGILPVWKDYSGKGVRIGQFEPGGNFSVTKEVLDYRHADLQANIDPVWLANPTSGQLAGEGSGEKFSTHATLVAGVIAADKNGEGAVGVAYDATIAGHWIGRMTETSPQDLSGLAYLMAYDVANNSWTVKPSFAGNFAGGYYQGDIINAARYGRGGLGTVMVAGGGNDRAAGGNANYDNFGNNRYEIQVGAINAITDLGVLQVGTSPFSNPGASLLVSAPGSNIASTSRLIQNENGSVFGTDYETAQGTSFATPIVTGVVALMLEANPELGYRDVQEILALSAKKVADANTVWQDNHATGWNGGAMHVSHDYGFGEVDALAAVRLAETWTSRRTLSNESSFSSSVNAGGAAIPDTGGGNWLEGTFTMAAGLTVEHAEVTLNLTHQQAGDLIVKLISPAGTESILINRPGKAPGSAASERGDATFSGSNTLNYTLSSTRNWGESSAGNWKVQVIDAATGQTGTLGSINLALYGRSSSVDDTYVYTNEYAGLAGSGGRNALNDTNGGRDTLNASAVTGASTVNLSTGTSSIGGTALTISNPGNIENVFTGDGNDTLIGNSGANLLGAGRGTNTLTGGGGQDVFLVQKRAGETDTITDFDAAGGERVLLANFDGKQYADLVLTQQGAHVNVALGGGQALVLQNTTVAALNATHFEFQESFQAPRGYVDSGVSLQLPGGGTFLGDESANVLFGTSQSDTMQGAGGDDELRGGAGNDVLDGGSGNDRLFGEAGDDTLYLDGDSYGLMLNSSGITFTSGQATGGSGADAFVVRAAGANLITDFELENPAEKIDLTAMGIASFSALSFSQSTLNGTPVAVVSSGGQTLASLLGIYTGQLSGANFIFTQSQAPVSTAGGDAIDGDAGGNFIDGLAGADTMAGRTGDDTYVVDDAGDVVIELPGGGFDTVRASVSYALPAEVENLVLTGTGHINGTGNSQRNRIVGNGGNNLLDGGGGSDILIGGAGNDTYVADDGSDAIIEQEGEGTDTVQSSVSFTLPNHVENLTLTGTDAVNATGNSLANVLTGNASDNRLDGAGGADSMAGGAGDDIYFVDNAGDVVTENANEGVDTVISSLAAYTAGANVENITLAIGAVSGTGNALDNVLIGNSAANTLTGLAGNDYLDGGAGGDTLIGGAGDDVYVVDSASDTVTENANEGIDTILSSVTRTLGANQENLTLTGTANINGTGNALANVLTGNSGSNVLTGEAGDDTYYVGAGDTVVETYQQDQGYWQSDGEGGSYWVPNWVTLTWAGTDTVNSSVSFTLGAGVENLTLTGSGNINGTGNSLNNVLTGNAGANVLAGGAGNDTYNVGAGDTVTENAGEGTDQVNSDASFTLGANVENLTLTGTANINGTGNALANVLTGNSGHNVLDGGAGADTMAGGAGDDTYVVDSAGDTVTEGAGAGTDTVLSSISYTLGANVENLTLTGTGNIDGTGNGLANVLTGNAGNNVLAGGAGDDVYLFGTGSGQDTIVENDATAGNVDTIRYAAGIAPASVIASRSGTNLVLTRGADTVTVASWYAAAANKVERVEFADGTVWDATAIRALANLTPTVANPIPDQTAIAESAFSLTLASNAFADGDAAIGETLTLSASRADGSALPGWLSFNPGTGVFSGTPAEANIGSLQVKVTATDSVGTAVSDTFSLAVLPVNHAPTLANAIADQGATEDAAFSFTVPANTFAESDAGDSLTYTATRADGSALPGWLSFNATNRTFSGTPVNADVGVVSLKVKATDVGGLYASDTFDVTVANTNDAPTLANALPDQSATETVAFSYTVAANAFADVDVGDSLSFTALRADGSALPAWLAFNAGTRTFSGTPGASDIGSYSIRVTATDSGGATANDVFDLSVQFYGIQGTAGNDTLNGTAADDNIFGLAGNDALNGLAGNDRLDGGTGNDQMTGGPGDDIYYVDSASDTTIETYQQDQGYWQSDGEGGSYWVPNWVTLTWAGTDTVYSSVSFTLAAGVENLTLTGTGNTTATGNALNNVLTGNSGDNTFVVQNAGDTVVEAANGGIDTVQSSISWTLGANLENLTLTGSSSINGTGNALNNVLTGNSGVNTLAGGAGDDVYYVQNGADVVSEAAGEGTDLVYSDTSYTLGANVENLTLTGSGNINATGNALANVLTGNSGNNVLAGGAGDDTYYVQNAGDVVSEAVATTTYVWQDQGHWASDGEGGSYWVPNWVQVPQTTYSPGDGKDTVFASVSYTIAGGNDRLEYLRLTGTGNNTGTGNEFANYLQGNSGNNTLTGGAGIDALEGGAGDDTLSDSAGSDNGFLAGGAGNDTLNGGSGREFLVGGAGNDTISAGDGSDVVAFNRGDGQDSVTSGGSAQDNILSLGGGIRYADLKFRKVSNDLVLDAGQSESVTLKNWYASAKRFSTLQVVIEASADYNAGSGDATLNKKVQRFNLDSLATAFDQALAANPTLTEWALSNALTQAHLGGSDTEALGGDLAYYYGKNGTLATMGFDKALDVLGASTFGQQTQTVRPWDQLQQGVARLNQ